MIRAEAIVGVAFGTARDGDARSDADARRVVARRLGIPTDWATIRQVHGADVAVATTPGDHGPADAIVTRTPRLPVTVATADCVPVVLAGDATIALVHAGWRGVALGVVDAAATRMADLGDPPTRAAIGPHIGPCCYEVGTEVIDAVGGHGSHTTWGTTSLDLTAAIVEQLEGVDVEVIDACTLDDRRFASYRRDRTETRQVTVAWVP